MEKLTRRQRVHLVVGRHGQQPSDAAKVDFFLHELAANAGVGDRQAGQAGANRLDPIELLEEHEPREVVRQGQIGEAPALVGA